jgi:hypothetical protein
MLTHLSENLFTLKISNLIIGKNGILDHNNLSCIGVYKVIYTTQNSKYILDYNNLSYIGVYKVIYTTQNSKCLNVNGEIDQTDLEQDKDKKSKIKTNEDGEDKKSFKSIIINFFKPLI